MEGEGFLAKVMGLAGGEIELSELDRLRLPERRAEAE